jgi:hypothetical protein
MENMPENLNFGFPISHKNEEKSSIKNMDATLYRNSIQF